MKPEDVEFINNTLKRFNGSSLEHRRAELYDIEDLAKRLVEKRRGLRRLIKQNEQRLSVGYGDDIKLKSDIYRARHTLPFIEEAISRIREIKCFKERLLSQLEQGESVSQSTLSADQELTKKWKNLYSLASE